MSKPLWLQRLHNDIAEYGCIACRSIGITGSPASIHHLEGRKKDHSEITVLPLCPTHHQYGPNAIHVNKVAFRREFGEPWELFINLRDDLMSLSKWPEQAETKLKELLFSPHCPKELKEAVCD
jgi:hypothetical protein